MTENRRTPRSLEPAEPITFFEVSEGSCALATTKKSNGSGLVGLRAESPPRRVCDAGRITTWDYSAMMGANPRTISREGREVEGVGPE